MKFKLKSAFFIFIFKVQDTEKTIRLLKSKTQPLIKKRQLMQLALGDYRKKMIDEEKKLKKGMACYYWNE